MPVSLYEDPLVYDILHSPGTADDVSGLLKIARRFCTGPVRTILEPACGSGRYLRVFAARGYNVIGFDLSPVMVRYAAARVREAQRDRAAARPKAAAPTARIFKADMRTFARALPAGVADFAFNPINSIRHLTSDAAVIAHLNQTARALRPGGAYAVGISLSRYGAEPVTEDVWSGSRDGARVVQVITYFPPTGPTAGKGKNRDERAHSHLTITERARPGSGTARRTPRVRHADSTYPLRTYNLAQWNAIVERSKLHIAGSVTEHGLDNPAREPGYCIFVLTHRPAARRGARA